MELEIPGYPLIIFYAVGFIGVALILYRPRWAFYFIVFGLAVRHFHMAVFTRTPFLGEFVNLNDLFLWIGVFAMLRISVAESNILDAEYPAGNYWHPRLGRFPGSFPIRIQL
jgi:hypothetical protein